MKQVRSCYSTVTPLLCLYSCSPLPLGKVHFGYVLHFLVENIYADDDISVRGQYQPIITKYRCIGWAVLSTVEYLMRDDGLVTEAVFLNPAIFFKLHFSSARINT